MERRVGLAAVLGFGLLAAVSPARADFLTANKLHELFQSSSITERAMAVAYVMGAVDGTQNAASPTDILSRACFPNSVTSIQVTDVVKKELERAPENRHLPAAWIVTVAVRNAFPCPVGK